MIRYELRHIFRRHETIHGHTLTHVREERVCPAPLTERFSHLSFHACIVHSLKARLSVPRARTPPTPSSKTVSPQYPACLPEVVYDCLLHNLNLWSGSAPATTYRAAVEIVTYALHKANKGWSLGLAELGSQPVASPDHSP